MSQREFGPIPPEYSLWMDASTGSQKWSGTLYSNIYEPRINVIVSSEHIITGSRSSEGRSETVGGILADDMGLGKTLTVLSTIIRTAEQARYFAEGNNGDHSPMLDRPTDKPQVSSRATLVIVSQPRGSIAHFLAES